MNAEIKSLNRFEEAGFDAGQSKAMVVGIDDLLVKSVALFNHRFEAIDHRFETIDHRFETINQRFEAIDHRFNALENSMRFQMIGLVGIIVAILIGFASLFYAISK